MKKIIALITAGIIMVSASTAAAQTNAAFTGPRVEATIGVDDVTKARDTNDVNYGAAIGYDVGIGDRVTVGIEGNTNDVFDRDRTFGVSGRIGVALTDRVLAYGTAGYANFRSIDFSNRSRALDGLRVGGGLEARLSGPVYGKIEYRYTDFDRNVGRHQGLVGVGLRF